jgi:hypothetical protein
MRNGLMTRPRRPSGGQDGAILVLALLTLAMITVMGVFSATRSVIEMQIANNMENQVMAFYAAEAGISHGRKVLQNEFIKHNQEKLRLKGILGKDKPNWNFILDGTYNGTAAGAIWCGEYPSGALNDCAHGASAYDGIWSLHGVDIVTRTWTQGNKTILYTVTVWDDVDWQFTQALGGGAGSYTDLDGAIIQYPGGDNLNCTGVKSPPSDCFWDYNPTDEQDAIIYVRSKGQVFIGGQELSAAVHELVFEGQVSARSNVIPGLAQEFANEGHSSSGMDLNEISTANLGSSRAL